MAVSSVTIGLLSAIFGGGGGIGIVAAGPIVQSLNWHWLFWFPAGRIIMSVALVTILLAVSDGQKWGWGSARTLSVFTLGALALVIFVLVELRVRQPLIDVRLFTIRGVWTAHVVSLIVGFALFGVFVLIPP